MLRALPLSKPFQNTTGWVYLCCLEGHSLVLVWTVSQPPYLGQLTLGNHLCFSDCEGDPHNKQYICIGSYHNSCTVTVVILVPPFIIPFAAWVSQGPGWVPTFLSPSLPVSLSQSSPCWGPLGELRFSRTQTKSLGQFFATSPSFG